MSSAGMNGSHQAAWSRPRSRNRIKRRAWRDAPYHWNVGRVTPHPNDEDDGGRG